MDFCRKHGLPFRNLGFDSVDGKTTSLEKFTGTGSWLDKTFNYIGSIKDAESGEVLFHPGEYDPSSPTTLNREREIDVIKVRRVAQYAKDLSVSLVGFKEI